MDSLIHLAIYYEFERELNEFSDYIFVDSAQQGVYSIKASALILKIGSEIESISKTICEKSGRHISSHHFDTNCIAGIKHTVDAIAIVGAGFHFENAEDTILWPFVKDERKTDHRTMTYSWNNAYQNIKHGTIEHTKQFGTIRYALRALCALYVLNFELNGNFPNSTLFARISGDSIISNAGIVWGEMITLSPEQKKVLESHKGSRH